MIGQLDYRGTAVRGFDVARGFLIYRYVTQSLYAGCPKDMKEDCSAVEMILTPIFIGDVELTRFEELGL